MPADQYWSKLVFKLDEEIQRLEAIAQPDEEENKLRKLLQEDE